MALYVGIVEPDASDAYAAEATESLNSIFTEINEAFIDVNSEGLTLYSFDSWDKLQKNATEGTAFCFTMGWNRYVNNPADSDPERDFSLEVRTSYEWLNMTDANINQDQFYLSQYSEKSILPYYNTDMLQVMTTATKVVIDQVSDSSGTQKNLDTLSVMYTPMAGDYTDYGTDGISFCVAIVIEIVALCLARTMASQNEPREDMIMLIMKRLGVQKSVMVVRDLVVGLVYLTTYSILAAFLFWIVIYSDCLSLGLLLCFIILNNLQINLRQIIMNYTIPPKAATGVASVLLIVQISLSYAMIRGVP